MVKLGLSVFTIFKICKVLDIDANSLFAGIIPPSNTTQDSFIFNSVNLFDEKDKSIVNSLITYIINSKE